jgi:hypothetical protein
MHLHMVRVAARPKAQAVRPAKVVSLEVRRKARLEAAAPRPPLRPAA